MPSFHIFPVEFVINYRILSLNLLGPIQLARSRIPAPCTRQAMDNTTRVAEATTASLIYKYSGQTQFVLNYI